MQIRKMKPEDSPRIAAINESAWNDNTLYKLLEDRYGLIGSKDWRRRKVDDMQSFCREHPNNVIVAVEDGSVVGYAAFTIDNEDKVGHVSNNAVDPHYQGRGIGSAMNRWVLDHFGGEGVKIARVSTLLHDQAARRVYEKNGFEELARTIHYSMQLANNE